MNFLTNILLLIKMSLVISQHDILINKWKNETYGGINDMLYINLSNEELMYFNKLQELFPSQIFVKTEHGFDMSSSIQIVIDISDILKESLPYIIAAVEAVLVYRIQKQQNKLKEKEYELEQEKASNAEFEIHYSSNGETQILIKTSDIDQILDCPEKLAQLKADFEKKLEVVNERA